MNRGAAECADIGYLRAVGEEGAGHDRAVAAELVEARIELEVRALARRAEDALAELADRRDRREILALARAHRDRRHDGVDEAVEAEHGLLGGEDAAAVAQFLERAGFEVHRGR